MSASRKPNILMMHDTCKSKVKVEECNCLIMLKDGSSTEYSVGGGEVVAVEVQSKRLQVLEANLEINDDLKGGSKVVNRH